MDIYERMFIHAFANDGELSQQELEEIMNMAVRAIQQKAWDCDVEATQALLAGAHRRIRPGRARNRRPPGGGTTEYNRWYWWYHNDHGSMEALRL
jgi:hypothetical protein